MTTPLQQLHPALNAYSFTFNDSMLSELRSIYLTHVAPILDNNPPLLAGGELIHAAIHYPDYRFFIVTYNEAPLLWISNNDYPTYLLFKKVFDAMNIQSAIKQLIDYNKDVILYSGFFVVGDHLDNELWHVDYFATANAYTLITPLFDLGTQHGNLLYGDDNKISQLYEYKMGEAIIFGDGFLHTTQPYAKSKPRVLFCLQFGTDKTEHWPVLEQTIGSQSKFMVLPCGHVVGTCECVVLKHRDFYVS